QKAYTRLVEGLDKQLIDEKALAQQRLRDFSTDDREKDSPFANLTLLADLQGQTISFSGGASVIGERSAFRKRKTDGGERSDTITAKQLDNLSINGQIGRAHV